MVLADGTFDPIHLGHVRYLDACAVFGAVFGGLTVRVAPDADVLAKGRLLFQSQEERAETIAAFAMVDDVCTDQTLAGAIYRLRPSYLIKGLDWKGRLPVDVAEACTAVGAQVIYTETQERSSTERLRA